MEHIIFIEDLEKQRRQVDQQIALLRRATFNVSENAFDFENYYPYD